MILASASNESDGIGSLLELGIPSSRIIDTDGFRLDPEMPDPLLDDGSPNDDYMAGFMAVARQLGRAIWAVFGPRIAPDFIVERPDRDTLHYSAFLLRDHDENDPMCSGFIVAKGSGNLSILGSHMYNGSQAAETVRLLASGKLALDAEDLDVVTLRELPAVQQRMLDGTMAKPKGVALVQSDGKGRSIADYEVGFVGDELIRADVAAGRFVDVRLAGRVAVITLTRPDALNALNEELLGQLREIVDEVGGNGTIADERVEAMIVRGAGRAFVAGADVQIFLDRTAADIEALALANMAAFSAIEGLPVPVVSLIDGFALGGGNELAMSTHYRIVTENASLGQPEVKLGIIPGYGGMQRLPRLVGPELAAAMACNGEPLDGRAAVAAGLADEFHPAATSLVRAFVVATEMAAGERSFGRPDWDKAAADQRDHLDRLLRRPEVAALTLAADDVPEEIDEVGAARRFAAGIALRAMRDGYADGFDAGIATDAVHFGRAVTAPSGQHWVRAFLDKDPRQSSFLTILPEAG